MNFNNTDLKRYSKLYLTRRPTLLSVVFFITTRCNQKCHHCFYWSDLNKKEHELDLDEINRMSPSMGTFDRLSLTGGEPFIRKDIDAIAKLFYKNNQIKQLTIATNGSFTEDIVNCTQSLLASCPDLTLSIPISLDGVGEDHDEIRGIRGSFDKAIETYTALHKISKKYPRLNIGVTAVCTKRNHHKIREIYDYIKNRFGINIFNVNYIRGDVMDENDKNFDISSYRQITKFLQQELLNGKQKDTMNLGFSQATDIMKYDYIYKHETKHAYTKCFAGRTNIILYSNGDIAPCEILNEDFGNIREVNYDFQKIWNSRKAQDFRKRVWKKKCSCTHECHVPLNLALNPLNIPRILYLASRIKRNKRFASANN